MKLVCVIFFVQSVFVNFNFVYVVVEKVFGNKFLVVINICFVNWFVQFWCQSFWGICVGIDFITVKSEYKCEEVLGLVY